MKNKLKYQVAIIFVVILTCFGRGYAQPSGAASFEVFYNELSPFGEWIDDPEYGYVWVPNVEADFRPYYTNGYWIMTEYGNTWVSNYPWGWAPFHYGRWTFNAYYGWIWMPDYVWGPAWVAWRWSAGYYGWAPLSPGILIGVSFTHYYCPNNWWVFLPPHYIHHHSFHNYVYGPRESRRIINKTTIINNTYLNTTNNTRYLTGPRREEITRTTRNEVRVYRVEDMPRPGAPALEGDAARMHRPVIERTDRIVAPQKVTRAPRAIGEPQEANTRTDRPFRASTSNREPVLRQAPVVRPESPGRARPEMPAQERTPVPQQKEQPRQPSEERRVQPAPAPQQPSRTKPERIDRAPAERQAAPQRPAQPAQTPARTKPPQRPTQPAR